MNGAQWLRGVDNGGNGVTDIKPYDSNQGFGRLSLQGRSKSFLVRVVSFDETKLSPLNAPDSVYLPGKTEVQLEIFDRQFVKDGRYQEHTVKIDKSAGCTYPNLSVTLVWVEPGSNPYVST